MIFTNTGPIHHVIGSHKLKNSSSLVHADTDGQVTKHRVATGEGSSPKVWSTHLKHK